MKEEPFWEELLEEAGERMIILLFVTGFFYAIIGGLEDALVILAVILILLRVEVMNEFRAGRAIVSLRRLAEPVGLVRRAANYVEVQMEDVVPGTWCSFRLGGASPPTLVLWKPTG